MADANLVIWTTDWHVVSNDSETSITGQPTTPTKAQTLVAYLNSLQPLGCIDTGDAKDHYYGTGTTDEHDNYITYVGNELNWLALNTGFNAEFPNLPGNHDEFYDMGDVGVGNNNFAATYDTKFWGAPYHWTADWDAPRIRFIAIHTYVHHISSAVSGPDSTGSFHIAQTELDWLEAQLLALEDGWTAIVCSHAPIQNDFGSNVRYTDTTFVYAPDYNDICPLLATYSDRVACVLSGHRHNNWGVHVQDNIPYIVSGGVSYGSGNGYGGFSQIAYSPTDRTLTFDYQYATSPYARMTGFDPYVVQLPDLPPDAVYGIAFRGGRPMLVRVRPT